LITLLVVYWIASNFIGHSDKTEEWLPQVNSKGLDLPGYPLEGKAFYKDNTQTIPLGDGTTVIRGYVDKIRYNVSEEGNFYLLVWFIDQRLESPMIYRLHLEEMIRNIEVSKYPQLDPMEIVSSIENGERVMHSSRVIGEAAKDRDNVSSLDAGSAITIMTKKRISWIQDQTSLQKTGTESNQSFESKDLRLLRKEIGSIHINPTENKTINATLKKVIFYKKDFTTPFPLVEMDLDISGEEIHQVFSFDDENSANISIPMYAEVPVRIRIVSNEFSCADMIQEIAPQNKKESTVNLTAVYLNMDLPKFLD
jgi:hypothetical protein